MKKTILACALLVGVLAGCSNVVSDEAKIEESTSESTVEKISEETVLTENSSETTLNETIADDEYSWQLQVLFDNKETWERSADHPFAETDEMVEDWYFDYAVTDLDSDGYLELLKVASFNNGPVTKLMLFEVTEDGDLDKLEYEYKGPVTNMSDSTDKVYLCWFNEISLSNLDNSYMMFTGE
ncbi:MAG: hypothetical protein K6G47_06435 [Clostridia bacterium]|nr:hypothetical protein [Clostridia bacterium]